VLAARQPFAQLLYWASRPLHSVGDRRAVKGYFAEAGNRLPTATRTRVVSAARV